jgi:hypothetical protein
VSATEEKHLFIGLKNGTGCTIIGEYVEIKAEINSALKTKRQFIEVIGPSLQKGYIKVSEICTLKHATPKQKSVMNPAPILPV